MFLQVYLDQKTNLKGFSGRIPGILLHFFNSRKILDSRIFGFLIESSKGPQSHNLEFLRIVSARFTLSNWLIEKKVKDL